MKYRFCLVSFICIWATFISCKDERVSSRYLNEGIFEANTNKNYIKAIGLFSNAIKEDDNNIHAYKERSKCYIILKEYSKAIDDLGIAIDKNNSVDSVALILRANTFRLSGRPKEAIADYNKIINHYSNHTQAINLRAALLIDMGDMALALEDLNRVLSIDSNYCEAYVNRAIVLRDINETELSLEDCQRAIEKCPDFSHGYFNRGVAYVIQHKLDNALKDYNKAIELENDNGTYYLNRGNLYLGLNKIDSACSDWNRAMALGNKKAQPKLEQYCTSP